MAGSFSIWIFIRIILLGNLKKLRRKRKYLEAIISYNVFLHNN